MHVTRSALWAAGVFCLASAAIAAQAPRNAAEAFRQTALQQDHPGQYDRADIEAGSRLYAAQCVTCHGPTGDLIAGVDLRRGQFKTVSSDEEIARVIASGKPGTGMPPFALQPNEVSGIIAYIRAGFDVTSDVRIGNAERGRAVFGGKGGCATCHRLNGRGPRGTTDLTDIGAIRTPAALQRSLFDPSGSLLPASRAVTVTTRDGRTIRGRRLNEDTYTIQLMDEQERLVSLTKADLKSIDFTATSAMPSYEKTLTSDEAADLIAYLLSLKGQ
jgi:putative heme-binding domain-containing protein